MCGEGEVGNRGTRLASEGGLKGAARSVYGKAGGKQATSARKRVHGETGNNCQEVCKGDRGTVLGKVQGMWERA